MSVKIQKIVEPIGEATESAVSFMGADVMEQARQAVFRARRLASENGLLIGPAKVKIIVEQEFSDGS